MNMIDTAMMWLGYMTAISFIAGGIWIFLRKSGAWAGVR